MAVACAKELRRYAAAADVLKSMVKTVFVTSVGTSVVVPPAMLTKPWHFFIAVDMPFE